ncbi:MAG TPA: AI-2E family transporter, partial [Tepidisphaeraceae bacterium]|nr:AI-2E family transporter [Tepidisphaeraceae bacterium]
MKPPPSRWIALLLITALALYLTWLVIQPFVIVILWAVVLTIVAQRPYRWLRSRGSGPNVSALLATVMMVLCVIVPVAVIGFGVARQVTEIVPEIQRNIGQFFGPEATLRKWLGQQSLAQKYLDPADLRKYIEQFSSVLTGWAVVVAGGVLSTIVQFVLVLFAMYYL